MSLPESAIWLRGYGLNEVRSWRPEQCIIRGFSNPQNSVSMKSGLGDRNNIPQFHAAPSRDLRPVSMKSCLGDRNNWRQPVVRTPKTGVSMKSGLGDRNNSGSTVTGNPKTEVSMKSGLGDRNNPSARHFASRKRLWSQ